MPRTRDQRRRRLIEPRLQLRFVLAFLSISSLYVLLQGVVLGRVVAQVAAEVPQGEELLLPAFLRGLWTNLVLTAAVLVPVTVWIGTYMTFRVAGPVYRFRMHLGQIAAGEDPGPCRLRKGDELQDLCAVLNRAVDRLRAEARGEVPAPAEAPDVDAVAAAVPAAADGERAPSA